MIYLWALSQWFFFFDDLSLTASIILFKDP